MAKRPTPPGPLDKESLKFYNNLCKYLIDNNLIQEIDSVLIYQAAVWWGIYLVSVKGVQENGTTVTYPTGAQQVSPYVTNMSKANMALSKLLDKLGVGETARQKLKMGTGSDAHDPMDDL